MNIPTRKMFKKVICPYCNGCKTIKDNTGDVDICEVCNGEGILNQIVTIEFEKIQST